MNEIKVRLSTIPKTGMGATLVLWSDRHAYTILEVSQETTKETFDTPNGRKVIVHFPKWIKATRDFTKRADKNGAYSEAQDYEYTTNYDIKQSTIFAYNKKTHAYREATYISSGSVSQSAVEQALAEGRNQIFSSKAKASRLVIGERNEYFDFSF